MPRTGERGRYCVDPIDAADANGKDLYVALSTNATCRLYGPRQTGVTVWTMRAALESARKHFDAKAKAQDTPKPPGHRHKARK